MPYKTVVKYMRNIMFTDKLIWYQFHISLIGGEGGLGRVLACSYYFQTVLHYVHMDKFPHTYFILIIIY